MQSARPTLAAYNTVERMLRGDFFHTTHWHEVAADLARYPSEWPIAGIGTTNWYRRNGETIVTGTAGSPEVLWTDPAGDDPMEVIDLLKDEPSTEGPKLVNPDALDGDSAMAFPFLALGVCDPATVLEWEIGSTEDLHAWIRKKLEEENIGLAAVRVEGECCYVHFSAAFYLPLEGLNLEGGYAASHNMKLAEFYDRRWNIGGIYAANPTLQRIISVEGLPLHLHGVETRSRHGGHIIKLRTEGAEVKVWPLKDLVMRIRNLDHTWLPVRNVGRPGDVE